MKSEAGLLMRLAHKRDNDDLVETFGFNLTLLHDGKERRLHFDGAFGPQLGSNPSSVHAVSRNDASWHHRVAPGQHGD